MRRPGALPGWSTEADGIPDLQAWPGLAWGGVEYQTVPAEASRATWAPSFPSDAVPPSQAPSSPSLSFLWCPEACVSPVGVTGCVQEELPPEPGLIRSS